MKAFRIFLIALSVAVVAPPVFAQAQTDCAVTELTDPVRKVLDCGAGLVIEIDAAAELGVVANNGDGRSFSLDSGAALIEVEPGSGPQQIRTPHAIAAVRGTVYVVDVQGGKTSVLVREGVVTVTPAQGGVEAVELEAGEGVDVSIGNALTVTVWGEARVAELMARFGR